MLALVTCHIFPPQSDTEKNEFLAPDFPADSLQFFRVHGFTSAVRQMPTAMRNPFAWTNVSSGKKACFAIWPHVGTKFFNLSHHFLSMDGWPGDAIFFLWGQPLKIIHKNSAKKRSSPLDFIFDTCASASSSHLFLVGEAEHVVVPLLQGQMYFQKKKTPVLQFGRVDTKFLNSSHHVYLWMIGLEMRLFSCGANLWRSSASIQSKKVQPLGFYFWPLRLGLLKSLFWLVKVNICVCTLLQSHVKNHTPSINHGTFFSWGLTFRYVLVNSHLIHPPSNSWLLTLGILQTYPLSESFMIDFLMPYIHRLIDQSPPITTDRNWFPVTVRQEAFRKKNLGLFWYDILFLAPCHAPGPSPTVC